MRSVGNSFGATLNDIATHQMVASIADPSTAGYMGQAAGMQSMAMRIQAALEFTRQTGQMNNVIAGTQAQLAHNPQAAFAAANQNAMNGAFQGTMGMPAVFRWFAQGQIRAHYQGAQDLFTQQFSEQTARDQFGIESRTTSNNILAGQDARYGKANPALLGPLARLNDYVSGIRAQERDAITSGRPELVGALGAEGRSGLAAMKAEYMRSFSGFDIGGNLNWRGQPAVLAP